MIRMWNFFLKYEHGGETSFLSIGRNVFPEYELGGGRNISLNNGANWLLGEKFVYSLKHSQISPFFDPLHL